MSLRIFQKSNSDGFQFTSPLNFFIVIKAGNGKKGRGADDSDDDKDDYRF